MTSSHGSILVTGGAGYIGSHTCKALLSAGWLPVTLDNLSQGHRHNVRFGPFIQADIGHGEEVRRAIRKYQIKGVLHFASYLDVAESVRDPQKYYHNNVIGSLRLLEACLQEGITEFVFSSTCATYGDVQSKRISEDHPQNPLQAYGSTKLAVERALFHYREALGLRSMVLRYFNAAGADPEGELGEEHRVETHLIPNLLKSALSHGAKQPFHFWGDDYPTEDGTCVRDYIHVFDLARAHVQALEYLRQNGSAFAINIGTGQGASVRQVHQMAEKVVGQRIAASVGPRRKGDAPELVSDNRKMRSELGFEPKFSDLHGIVQSAWNWEKKQWELHSKK